jgi:radical SAM protein with 4Fe4S-binding SPASM domain
VKKKYQLDCASWEITLQCNLKCFHCEFSAGKPLPDELTTEEALQLCKDLAEINCKRIILMGGEVFLRKDWHLVAQKIKQLDMELAFITNGYIIAKTLIDQLKSLRPVFVGVSIDGGNAQTHDKIRGVKGSFHRALQFIDLCINANIPVIVITSVHKLNIKELPTLMDVLFNKDILRWEVQITDIEGRFPKEYLVDEEEFYSVGEFITRVQKQHPKGERFVCGAHDMGYNSSILPELTGFNKWIGCPAGISLLAIESNGGVKGCSALTGKFVEGNIRKRSIKEIWNDPSAFAYNRQFKKEDLKGYCRICKYGETCKGGCIETAHMLTGNIHCDSYCFHRIEEKQKKKENVN